MKLTSHMVEEVKLPSGVICIFLVQLEDLGIALATIQDKVGLPFLCNPNCYPARK